MFIVVELLRFQVIFYGKTNIYVNEYIYIYTVKCFGLWNINFIDTNQMHISKKKNISLEGMGSPTN